jgi:GT2 family glycosyltransferase
VKDDYQGGKMSNCTSIIIVNYNAGRFLAECIFSIVRNDSGSEIVIVDNASTDGSLDIIEAQYAGSHCIKLIKNEYNLGFAKGCNIGTLAAKGKFLLYLNPDCKLKEKTIGRLKHRLETNPNAGMAGGLILNDDRTEQPGCRRTIPTPWRSLVRAFGLSILATRYPRLFSDYLLYFEPLPAGPAELEAISGACMMVKREALEDVGMMDEGYFLHCEDLDWCMRFRMRGWKILFVPDAVLFHTKGVCSKKKPIFVEWSKHKGMIRFYNKFFSHQYPGILMWLVKAGVWLRFGMVILLYGFRKTFQAFRWKAWIKRLSGY